MRIRARTYDLELEVPFAISRGTTSVHTICVAEISHQGLTGYGEASPSRYYGDNREKALAAMTGAGRMLGDDPFALEVISRRLRENFPESPSGRAAVEMALYDLVGKMVGLPVYRWLGLAGAPLPKTSLTVGVTDVEVARRRLDFLKGFPILKAKVGFGDEMALLSLLRDHTEAVLRVDANEGWSVEEAIDKVSLMSREFAVEIFEQPLPKGDLDGYRRLRQSTSATIIVDESAARAEDLPRWSGLVDGVNVKIMKCGGLGEAMRMIWTARALGLSIMLGCMVESSLAITAAAHIAGLVDYCDLDGNLLVSNDPFRGVEAWNGILRLPEAPGLGVTPVA
jgi:L-alanine-DL-glutamate epimerase-like enolase superfamily enzyme